MESSTSYEPSPPRNPEARPCPIGWPSPPHRLLSASTAPSHPNHTEGLPFPSPWQCTHPAVVTPATQESPPSRVTTCSHGPALRSSSRTNMAPPRHPHSPTSPLLCLGHCGPCPLQAGLTVPLLNTQLRLFPRLLLRQTAPHPLLRSLMISTLPECHGQQLAHAARWLDK